MSAVDDLVAAAQRQLDEHKVWLAAEIYKLPVVAVSFPMHIRAWLVAQADQIRLRVASAAGGRVQVVYEYPDELHAFLSHPSTPEHLRATLEGGHAVDPEKPSSTVRRLS